VCDDCINVRVLIYIMYNHDIHMYVCVRNASRNGFSATAYVHYASIRCSIEVNPTRHRLFDVCLHMFSAFTVIVISYAKSTSKRIVETRNHYTQT